MFNIGFLMNMEGTLIYFVNLEVNIAIFTVQQSLKLSEFLGSSDDEASSIIYVNSKFKKDYV